MYYKSGMFFRDAFLKWLLATWHLFSTPFGISMNALIEKNAIATGNHLRNS